jgi:hypothetical protein
MCCTICGNNDDVNVESFLKVEAVICFESLVTRSCSTRCHFTDSHSLAIRHSGSQNLLKYKVHINTGDNCGFTGISIRTL